MMAGMDEQNPAPEDPLQDPGELPPDPDLDDLPDVFRMNPGPFTVVGWDRETGERFEGRSSRSTWLADSLTGDGCARTSSPPTPIRADQSIAPTAQAK
jgi:hypothetical protein